MAFTDSPLEPIPEHHPLGRFFRRTTESAFESIGLRDGELIVYVWKLLLKFTQVDNLFRRSVRTGERLERVVDFLEEAEGAQGAQLREIKRQMGDVCLFFTGLFPESLSQRKRNPRFYISQGKAAYYHVAEMDALRPSAKFFRKITDEFEACVMALNIERQFLTDEVYQYIGRQFDI